MERESSECGAFVLFTWLPCKAASVCMLCSFDSSDFDDSLKKKQHRNKACWIFDRMALRVDCFIFTFFFLFPYHLSYFSWHICCTHKLSLFFLWVPKNGNLALVLARRKTCRILSPLWKRLEAMFSNFNSSGLRNCWQKIEHFCYLGYRRKKSLQYDTILPWISLSHLSLSCLL